MKRAQRTLYPEDPSEVEPRRTLDTPLIRAISAPDDLKQWLAGGWHDLARGPAALLHGVVVAAVGALMWHGYRSLVGPSDRPSTGKPHPTHG